VSTHTFPKYRWKGRFVGRRVNCARVPLLPASLASRVLDDPRGIPYLFVWRSPDDGTVREAVRVVTYSEPSDPYPLDWTGWIEIKRPDGTHTLVRTILRQLPRNGGKAGFLVCPLCEAPSRALYGWRVGGQFTNSTQRSAWGCRACQGLRYSSEGGALVFRGRGLLALLGPSRADRPQSWYPHVVANPKEYCEL
jgi:hypothetical protein